jgi:ABC-type glycerol-3-phosphate transport system substrate-binding protein
VAAVAAGGAYYALTPPTTTPTAPSMTSSTAAATMPATSAAATTAAPPSTQLVFSVWEWNPAMVQENVNHFNQEYNENARMDLVPGDFYATMESRLIAKTPEHMCYIHMPWLTRWYKAGWLQPLDDIPGIDAMSKDMIPYLWDYVQMPDGKHVGSIYWFGTFTLLYNGKILQKAGLADTNGFITDPPKTWDDVLSQCLAMKKAGISDTPLIHRWNQEFSWNIMQGFEFQCITEGEPLVDIKTHDPSFDVDTPVMDVCNNWVDLYSKGVVPQGILTETLSENEQIFATGNYAYAVEIDYNIGNIYNNPATSPDAGSFHILTPQPGKAQVAGMVSPAFYALTNQKYYNRPDDEQSRADNLFLYYSWKDKDGSYYVPKKWMQQFYLGQGFVPLFSDPDIITSYGKYYSPKDWQIVKNNDFNAQPLWAQRGVVWYAAWREKAQSMMQSMVLGKVSAKDTVTNLRTLADQLRKQYGGIEVWSTTTST